MRTHHRPPWPLFIGVLQIVGAVVAFRDRAGPAPLAIVLLLAGPLLLFALYRQTALTVAAVCGVAAGWLALGYPLGPVVPSLVAAVIGAVVRGARPGAWLSLAGLWLAWLGFGLADLRPLGTPLQELRGLGLVALLAFAAELVDNRRQRIIAFRKLVTEERLRRHEEEQRRAGEQRLRIARDLHDVLAHSLSLITVRASVALEVMDTNPDEVRPALLAIKQASRDGLDEVRAVLAGLRSPDDTSAAPRSPTPDLDRLGELLDDASTAGLTVTLTSSGTAAEVPAAVGLAAYRIIQEALTNVVRHSQARTAAVHLHHAAGSLTIGVVDGGPPQQPTSDEGGNGLIGIRERASALGGTASCDSTPDGGFTVMALLPTGTGGKS
ncbi:signal transduction histidine kinase [Allocatelliglobosispora scoriae]|uniref:histidine kinase n=1 Tax=Allocatelliglobosispora scoriae TaxID=643052 RepID=A0A841BYW3_9ACTN|nr:sensor histidine kinase [Allocatelliglobosispora scoriae]MBB5872113.1 signal transduction histidine kinase [Allocatelliglobosispora scoriae]